MKDEYLQFWCYKQAASEDRCTAPIIHGTSLCGHAQPECEPFDDYRAAK